MKMFYYVKGARKGGTWSAVEADNPERLTSEGVFFSTILACSERVGYGKPAPTPDSTYYQGPFYLDIDSLNPRSALATARKAVQALQNVGVREEDIYIWLTGKKGYHIVVPQECFLTDKPTLYLPLIYKALAVDLKLEVDYRVYSMGRGRMWRVPNKQRSDNRLFKVAVTVEELFGMKPSDYEELCKQPRDDHEIQPGEKIPHIDARVARAKAAATEQAKIKAVFVDPEAKEALKDEEMGLPPCGRMMMHGEIKGGVGFNDLSLQFAKVIQTFGGTHPDALIKEFAENSKGQSYDTAYKREVHLRSALPAAKNYKWACRSALSVLSHQPCEDCPLSYLLFDDEKRSEIEGTVDLDSVEEDEIPTIKLGKRAVPESAQAESKEQGTIESYGVVDLDDDSSEVPTINLKALKPSAKKKEDSKPAPKKETKKPSLLEEEDLSSSFDFQIDLANPFGLVADEVGYSFLADKGKLRYVTNFTIRIVRVYKEWIPALNQFRRTGVMADVYQGYLKIGQMLIEEPAWDSKASFLKCLGGLSNLGFHGKDDDIQKMRMVLMEKSEQYGEVVHRVHSFGIHHEQVAEQDVFTYVEPGWTIDSLGQENKYSLLGNRPPNAPTLAFVDQVGIASPEMKKLLLAFMTLNEPRVSSQVLGWISACFIKRHIEYFMDRQFPLLNVYGNAASGKTMGMLRYVQLFGTPPTNDPVHLPSAKNFQIWKTLSDSETCPIIMDEYNISKLGKKRYEEIAEYFKASWQRGSVSRGVVGQGDRSTGRSAFGADLINFSLCSPVIMCSEQGLLDIPAVITRTVQVPIRPKGLDWNDSTPRRSFIHIGKNRELVYKLSKFIYMIAIRTSIEEVRDAYFKEQKLVPIELGDRPQHAYTTLLTGLWFWRKVCNALEMKLDPAIETLRENVLALFTLEEKLKEITQAKSRSEVDIVCDTFATMAAAVHDADFTRDALKPDLHYKVINGILWIDLVLTYSTYRRYMSNVERQAPVIPTPASFLSLAQNEAYYHGARKIEDMGRGSPLLGLDMKLMGDKGIMVEGFMRDPD